MGGRKAGAQSNEKGKAKRGGVVGSQGHRHQPKQVFFISLFPSFVLFRPFQIFALDLYCVARFIFRAEK